MQIKLPAQNRFARIIGCSPFEAKSCRQIWRRRGGFRHNLAVFLAVGLLGAVQLVPLALTALWGGAVADAFDRRRLLLWCELILMLCALALMANALAPHPSVIVLFAVAALMSAVSALSPTSQARLESPAHR